MRNEDIYHEISEITFAKKNKVKSSFSIKKPKYAKSKFVNK
jgi:hypothetical protein